ncbi:hypothetical protein [Pseudomonas protegens]|uniref:hypothetical protein n=1 Tax=Pseudomonas protegens TaxID=380021 RepID=UPI0018F3B3FD|nr:hypothetical protein [Pseudomonas protegens]
MRDTFKILFLDLQGMGPGDPPLAALARVGQGQHELKTQTKRPVAFVNGNANL